MKISPFPTSNYANNKFQSISTQNSKPQNPGFGASNFTKTVAGTAVGGFLLVLLAQYHNQNTYKQKMENATEACGFKEVPLLDQGLYPTEQRPFVRSLQNCIAKSEGTTWHDKLISPSECFEQLAKKCNELKLSGK